MAARTSKTKKRKSYKISPYAVAGGVVVSVAAVGVATYIARRYMSKNKGPDSTNKYKKD